MVRSPSLRSSSIRCINRTTGLLRHAADSWHWCSEGWSTNATRLVAAFGQKTLLYWGNPRNLITEQGHLAVDGAILPSEIRICKQNHASLRDELQCRAGNSPICRQVVAIPNDRIEIPSQEVAIAVDGVAPSGQEVAISVDAVLTSGQEVATSVDAVATSGQEVATSIEGVATSGLEVAILIDAGATSEQEIAISVDGIGKGENSKGS